MPTSKASGSDTAVPYADDTPVYGYAIDGKQYTLETKAQYDLLASLSTENARNWLNRGGYQPTGNYDTTGKLKPAQPP